MANPVVYSFNEWEWEQVTSSLNFGIINRLQSGLKYYITYRTVADPAPINPDPKKLPLEAVEIFTDSSFYLLPDSPSERDYYVICTNTDNRLGIQGKVRVDNIRGADSGFSRSSFGDLSTSTFTPLTGWSFTYNINPAVVNQTIIDTGVITNDKGHAVLTTGSSASGLAEISTVRSSRYIPGVGGTARFTAVFDTPQENSKQVIGIINGRDGWAFGYNGLDFGVLRKVDNVENWTKQEDWSENIKINFDPTKGNVFQIKYQWLGYGSQIFYMEDEAGKLTEVHKILYANNNTETSILNPNLPIGAYVVNFGNTTPITMKTPSAIAGLDGDAFNDAISVNLADDSLKTVTSGSLIPIIAFREDLIYKTKANRLFSQALRASVAADLNKSVIFRVWTAGTVTGGSWAYLSEDISTLEVNKTFTSYTPGLLIATFPLSKIDSYVIDFTGSFYRLYAGQQLVVTASTSGAGDVVCAVNWKSFV